MALKDQFATKSTENWLNIANEFNYRWNFPNCLGAIDGRHVPIVCPPNSGSLFFNYKVFIDSFIALYLFNLIVRIKYDVILQKFYSVVLMAVCDAKYKFLFVDVGAYGSEGDGGVFSKTDFGRKIYDDELPLPNDSIINGRNIPYYFVSDDAFALSKRIMKPYVPQRGTHLTAEERKFNYRLSRARRCIENAFGIMSSRWLCLNRTSQHGPYRTNKMILACCCLHNYLINNADEFYCPQIFADYIDENGDIIEGEWRRNEFAWQPMDNTLSRATNHGKAIRNTLKNYLNSPAGAVPWQNNLD